MTNVVGICGIAAALLLANGAMAENLAPFPKWSEPRRVTDGPKDHLLASYFAIDSWSPNRRYMSVLETELNGRLPEANERCTIGFVDLEDGNKFIPITTTACWNFQEAAMVHWMNDDEILFNDIRDGKFKTVIMNWRTKEERVLPMPVSAVSEDRTWAVSLNYARLSLTRPDYGYAGPGQDPLENEEWPEKDGLWTMDPSCVGRTPLDAEDQDPSRQAWASSCVLLPYRNLEGREKDILPCAFGRLVQQGHPQGILLGDYKLYCQS